MNREKVKDELDVATQEFLRTYNSFRDAAMRLMAVINSIRERNSMKMEEFSREEHKVHNFLIQVMDEKEHIVDKCFGLKCVAEEKE